jgi:hypothetical protein
MCTYREAVSILGLAAEVSHDRLGQRLEELGGDLELAFVDTEPTSMVRGFGPDWPHFGYGTVVAAEDDGFPCLDTVEVARKMRLGLVNVESDHKTIILVLM